MRSSYACVLAASMCVALAFPRSARAQESEEESPWEEGAPEAPAAAEAAPEPDKEPDSPKAAPTWWFGAYLQDALVPSFMLKLFLDEAPTVNNLGFGFTATHRSADGMSIVLGLGYQSYGFNGPFRVSGDPETDTEYLSSSLGILHVRGQFMWSTAIVPSMLSFEYGVGLDLGVVLGSMTRTEAYRDTAGNYQPCAAPGNPPAAGYCELPQSGRFSDPYDAHGAHYGVVEKRVPPIAGALMLPALGLRLTPIRPLAIQLNLTFGLLQFTFGLSAAYGFDL